MRVLIIIVSIISCMASLLGSDSPKPNFKMSDVYLDLRNMVLKLKPADVGAKEDSEILAVVMDTGFPEAAFTLASTVDGSASLYFSNGGGVIGAGEQPDGASAAKALIAEAAKFVGKMTPIKETPIATPGQTTFYIVTGGGTFTASAEVEDFGEGRHALSPLFHKAHELIAKIREIADKKAPAQK